MGCLKQGQILWRAQVGHNWRRELIRDANGNEIDFFETPAPLERHRMIPLADRAKEGRVNPKGIPCLYLCTDKETAMSEVRPWIGSYVSVAQLTILKDLLLIDCSNEDRPNFYVTSLDPSKPSGEPSPDIREKNAWAFIQQAFSEPVMRNDDTADYAPTQVLAETFRSSGYEGIVYQSKLGKGKNVAIFDLSQADIVDCHLFEVKSLKFGFSMAANPYFY